MNRKAQDLQMAAACLFFLLLSLAGLAAVLATGEVTGVDGLMMLMVCGGMALLFAWLTFSAVKDSGILGRHKSESAAPQVSANPAPAVKAEGKQST
ncbi:MAG TPA: hypothetical protein VMV61_01255 [Patescibacteria group bacterium]|nr:hypothetical protein [Patescibacteria group bacterium]